MTINQYIVVEYSVDQNCFHLETVEDMISRNRMDMLEHGQQTSYLPVGIFSTRAQACRFLQKQRKSR